MFLLARVWMQQAAFQKKTAWHFVSFFFFLLLSKLSAWCVHRVCNTRFAKSDFWTVKCVGFYEGWEVLNMGHILWICFLQLCHFLSLNFYLWKWVRQKKDSFNKSLQPFVSTIWSDTGLSWRRTELSVTLKTKTDASSCESSRFVTLISCAVM